MPKQHQLVNFYIQFWFQLLPIVKTEMPCKLPQNTEEHRNISANVSCDSLKVYLNNM